MHREPVIDVGARGFEPPTSWSQTTRSTKLSYAPNRAESLPRFASLRIWGAHAARPRSDGFPAVIFKLRRLPKPSFLVEGLAFPARGARSPVQRSIPNSARAVFRLRPLVHLAGSRNPSPGRDRSGRLRNILPPDAKNKARLRWRRDASQTIPLV